MDVHCMNVLGMTLLVMRVVMAWLCQIDARYLVWEELYLIEFCGEIHQIR